jgi:hypothetical protein
MRISRGLTLPTHGAIELLAGIAMMVAPAVLSFSAAGLLVSVTLGAILTGTAVSLSSSQPASSSVAAHSLFDTVFVLATALAALGLAAAGQTSAVLFLAAIVVVQAVLGFGTRYTAVDWVSRRS